MKSILFIFMLVFTTFISSAQIEKILIAQSYLNSFLKERSNEYVPENIWQFKFNEDMNVLVEVFDGNQTLTFYLTDIDHIEYVKGDDNIHRARIVCKSNKGCINNPSGGDQWDYFSILLKKKKDVATFNKLFLDCLEAYSK